MPLKKFLKAMKIFALDNEMTFGKVYLIFMHFLLGIIAKEIPGPALIADCLWCGQRAHAQSRKRIEWLMLFHLIPLFPFQTVFVRCDSCHQDMVARCSLEDLSSSNPATLKYLLLKKVSLIAKTCIALGLLLFWAFWTGLIPAIIGFIYGRQYGGRMKKWSTIGLILNIFSPVIFVIGYAIIKTFFK